MLLEKIALPIREAIERTLKSKITAIEFIKGGMTNNSYILIINGERFMLRLNGKDTELFIDRRLEEIVYKLIQPIGISDELLIIDSRLRFKLSRYIDNGRSLAMDNREELKQAMAILRKLHALDYRAGLKELGVAEAKLTWDIFAEIERYERISRLSARAKFAEYAVIKNEMLKLKPILDKMDIAKALTHMDAHYENYLVYGDNMCLVDFEYTRIADPLMDIAMQALFVEADLAKTNELIAIYGDKDISQVNREELFRVYYYMVIGGILWTNWCEMIYVQQGRSFGDYQQGQLNMAKKYAKFAREVMI